MQDPCIFLPSDDDGYLQLGDILVSNFQQTAAPDNESCDILTVTAQRGVDMAQDEAIYANTKVRAHIHIIMNSPELGKFRLIKLDLKLVKYWGMLV